MLPHRPRGSTVQGSRHCGQSDSIRTIRGLLDDGELHLGHATRGRAAFIAQVDQAVQEARIAAATPAIASAV